MVNMQLKEYTFRHPTEQMQTNLLVKHYAGSHAYGTSLPTSDVDFRGIFVADREYVTTPFFNTAEVKDTSEEDTVLFELRQFMNLAVACNPNVVETLWVDEKDIVFRHPGYDLIRHHRGELLSRKVAFTLAGYASSQLARIKGHKKWIANPQSEETPRQTDFMSLVVNFTSEKMFKFDVYRFRKGHRFVPYGGNVFGVYKSDEHELFTDDYTLNTAYEGDTHTLGVPLMIVKWNEQVYQSVKQNWENYWEWKRNRNEKRSVLEEKFGYDTKHAMHLVRLLRMGVEVLTTGELRVRRPDAAELLEIRNGKMTYEEIVKYGEDLDAHVKTLVDKSPLPRSPNTKLAARLVMQVQEMMWHK